MLQTANMFLFTLMILTVTSHHVYGHPIAAVDEKMSEFSKELDHFVELGYGSRRLQELAYELSIPDVSRLMQRSVGMQERLVLNCAMCKIVANTLLNDYRRNPNMTVFAETVINLCKTLKLASAEVCSGLVQIHQNAFLFLANHTDLTDEAAFKEKLCSLIVNTGSCVWEDEWTVDVNLGAKPAITSSQVQHAKTVTIVQLSDIHFDPTYTARGNAECGEPTCCRLAQGTPTSMNSAAGQWGDYRSCDLPKHTLQNTLDFIKKQHKNIDYIYVTGDYVDHAVWETGVESNSKIITTVVNTLAEVFTNTTIVYALGNHEANPVNAYAPLNATNDTSTNWLFELVSNLWSPYITDEAKQTILKGGYYSMKLQDSLRVIVLNNIVCYNLNLWLLYESQDPYGQLKWLAETLLQAEKDQEKVHILYHIPTGSKDCVRTWSREYHKIVDRFENTITAQFSGHSHNDEFHVFYSSDNTSRATNVVMNGGSVTTYTYLNMNYKVYTVDPSSWYILDAESWVYNLTDANLYPYITPDWFRLYSFREAYGVDSLVPSELGTLVERMCWDHDLLRKYHRFYVKGADPSLSCDDDCLQNRLCDIVTANSGDFTQCNIAKDKFKNSTPPPPPPSSVSAQSSSVSAPSSSVSAQSSSVSAPSSSVSAPPSITSTHSTITNGTTHSPSASSSVTSVRRVITACAIFCLTASFR